MPSISKFSGLILILPRSRRSYREEANRMPFVLKGNKAGSFSIDSWIAVVTGPVLDERGFAVRSRTSMIGIKYLALIKPTIFVICPTVCSVEKSN